MGSITMGSIILLRLLAIPRLTRPVPHRMAALLQSAAAPVFPVDPATTSRWP